jgi:hypothetical protein
LGWKNKDQVIDYAKRRSVPKVATKWLSPNIALKILFQCFMFLKATLNFKPETNKKIK